MKQLFLAVFGLFIAVIAGIGALVSFVNPNQFKPLIVEKFHEKTGRDIAMDGDISWRLFPSLGLDVSGLHVKNPAGFPQGDTLHVASAQVSLKLLPLLQKKVDLKNINLESVDVHVIQAADGRSNLSFQSLKDPQEEEKSAESELAPSSATPQDDGFDFDLAFDSITLNNTKVLYEDLKSNINAQLSNFSLSLYNFAPGEIGEITLQSQFQYDDYQGKIEFDTQIVPNKTFDILGLQGMRLVWSGDRLPLPESISRGELLADAELALGSQRFEFKNLRVLSGNFGAKGRVSYEKTQIPTLTAELSSSILNLDELLLQPQAVPANSDSSVTASKEDAQQPQLAKEVDTLDLSFLKNLNLNTTVAVDHLTYKGVQLRNMQMRVTSDAGLLTIENVEAQLYDGTVKATGNLDVRHSPASFKVNKVVRGVQLQPLLRDYAQVEHVSGTADIDINMKGIGLTPETIRRTLTGTTALKLSEGEIVGVDVVDFIKKAVQGDKSANETGSTEFSELSVTFDVKQAAAMTQDLRIVSPVFNASGWGRTNLVDESLDFMVDVVFSDDLLRGDAEKLRGKALPLRIVGYWSKPRYYLDVDKILREQVKKAQERLQEKVQDKLRETLSDLFR